MPLIIVAGAVLCVHWPVLSARATSLDDADYVTRNALVRNPGWASAKRFLTEVAEPSTVAGYYQPLAMISLMLDAATGGSPENLRPFHRTALTLHVLNAVLVVVLLYLLFGRMAPAAMAGLLYGLHPMTVEPVAWLGERKTLLATFFALWSLILYVRYARSGGWGYAAGCGGAYLLALLAKPTTVPLPLLMLVLDGWPLNRLRVRPESLKTYQRDAGATRISGRTLNRRAVAEKIPLFVLAAAAAGVTLISQGHTAQLSLPRSASAEQLLLLVCHNLVFYPFKMLWPAPLASIYPFPDPLSLGSPAVRAGVVGTVLILAALVVSLQWTRALAAGALFFVIALAPTLMNVGYSWGVAADKYVYLPAVGVLVVLAYTLGRWWAEDGEMERRRDRERGKAFSLLTSHFSPPRRIILLAVVAALGVAEARATRRYLAVWQDSTRLFEHMLTVAPRSSVVHNNLANALRRQGDVDGAIEHYREAIGLYPAWADPRYNLGLVLAERGDTQQAIACYQEALQRRPGYAAAMNDLGIARVRQDRIEEARELFVRALHHDPDYAPAQQNLANVLVMLGRIEEAIELYETALELRPDDPQAQEGLARARAGGNPQPDNVTFFRERVRRNPESIDLRNRLVNALFLKDQVDEAIAEMKTILDKAPDFAMGHFNLATILTKAERFEEAVEHYREALRLQPDQAKAHCRLGFALFRLGQVDDAIPHYQRAIELDPEYAEAENNLGFALAEKGRYAEAVAHYESAIRLRPGFLDAYEGLAPALAGAGRTQEAVSACRTVLQRAPDDADTRCLLAELLARQGHADEAAAEYNAVRRDDPSHERASKGLEALSFRPATASAPG